jgi:hypothetical protein
MGRAGVSDQQLAIRNDREKSNGNGKSNGFWRFVVPTSPDKERL